MKTAFDFFEKFDYKKRNSIDFMKNQIFPTWPIIYTDNTSDYSQVERYSDSKYVWLVDKNLLVSPTFPFWYIPDAASNNHIHVFPYIYKESRRVKSWDMIKLVPTGVRKEKIIKSDIIAGQYELRRNKLSLDVFFIDDYADSSLLNYHRLLKKVPDTNIVSSFEEAHSMAYTDMFWVVWPDTIIDSEFDFNFLPDEWSHDVNHCFLNGQFYDGVVLVNKHQKILKKEIENRFFLKRKEIPILASNPKPYDFFVIDSYQEYLDALKTTSTDLFWMSSRNIKIDPSFSLDFQFAYYNNYDKNENHAFIHRINEKDFYNGLFLLSKHKELTKKEIDHRFIINRKEWDIVASRPVEYDCFIIDTYEEYLQALEHSKTEMFWALSSKIKIDKKFKFDIYFTHDNVYDRNTNHAFIHRIHEKDFYNGVFLLSKHKELTKNEIEHRHLVDRKEWDIVASVPEEYNIVFISYQEADADTRYKQLVERFPKAKRVHGVKGIHQAHVEAAKLCSSEMFWVVDADAIIESDFNFEYKVTEWDTTTVHVWRSINPINGLTYGYGGVKLLPRELTLTMDITKPDMTTSISSKFKAMPDISNITAFNTDPFNTWRSAFRECVKLSSSAIDRQKQDETAERLKIWCSVGEDKPFGKYAIAGAKAGAAYGIRNQDNLEALQKINDFDWLELQFLALNLVELEQDK